MIRGCLLLLLTLTVGCMNTNARLEAYRDPKIEIDRQSRFAIRYESDQSIEHRQLHQILSEEFTRQGLTLVEESQADFIINYELSSQTSRIQDYRPYTTTDHYSGQLNGRHYFGTSTSTEYLPYEEDKTIRTIHLIATPSHVETATSPSAWECFLSADAPVFDKYLSQALCLMVGELPDNTSQVTNLKNLQCE